MAVDCAALVDMVRTAIDATLDLRWQQMGSVIVALLLRVVYPSKWACTL